MRQTTRVSTGEAATVRQSVTFTQAQHEALSEIAVRNDVSVGYVVRKACDSFIACHAEEACHELAEPSVA